jgi:WD40 repeat protein
LKIIKITNIDNERIKIFTNQNRYYVMKLLEEETNNNTIKVEESNVYKYSNNSVKYACSYMISNIEIPFLVYNDNQSIIKGGFWDGRLEINHLSTENKNEKIVQSQTIFYPDYSPITVMAMKRNEKMLLCGTKDGILISSKINKEKSYEYNKSYYIFDDEITSISINEKLNMFAVSSRDGFINLYIDPSFKLVRTISLNKNKKEKNELLLYADHIFLSNYPLACLTIYNNSKRLFKSYTINGEFICKINESDESSKIKCPIIYTNNSFQDILLYGTNDGFIKMRKFPEMTIVNSIPVFKGKEINSICISPDKKCCYVWSLNNVIAVIKDSELNKNI